MKDSHLSGEEVQVDDLTWREQEVLHLLAERRTNREIADQLHIVESTVKDYVSKILSKLYVKNRRQAVERARELGLLDRDQDPGIRPQTNLPAESTPFIGRRDELSEIRRQLGATRLLTLIGPGGIGKTRLALKAAEGAANDFENGRYFVALAPLRSAKHLIQTIAEAVRFPLATQEDPQHQLLRHLKKRQLLLVMDNFEHLLDGAGTISEILLTAPAVKILATSRVRLNLQSETIFNVVGMDFPDQAGLIDPLFDDAINYDAITLFIHSASKVRPGFDPTPDDVRQIANICQVVGGMPLAIELAAAWLHILNVDEIVTELEGGLDILATELRDAPHRHRSIRTVFDTSWSMLDQTEQEVFLNLSIFRGGFTRQAAQQVAGASLLLLAGLVNKSFLSHDPDSGRFEVHELLRQYGQERLESKPEACRSAQNEHAAYYAEFMRERWDDLKGRRQLLALAEIEADIENVRAAWSYDLEQKNAPQIWMFSKGLWHVYWIRWWNHAGMELFGEAVKALEGEEDEQAVASRALAKAFQGFFMAWLGLADQGYALTKDSAGTLEKFDHPEALSLAYDSLGVNAYMINRYSEEVAASNKMLAIATELNDPWLLAFSLFAVSMGTLLMEDYPEAKRLAESNLKINEEIGDVIGSALPLIVLGHASLALGEFHNAKGYYQRCLKISQQVGFPYAIQTTSKYLGKVSLATGEIVEAESHLLHSLSITKEIGFLRDNIKLL
jgi:predicted ATPase/DNA-binding CsgD family transcriptional regulator